MIKDIFSREKRIRRIIRNKTPIANRTASIIMSIISIFFSISIAYILLSCNLDLLPVLYEGTVVFSALLALVSFSLITSVVSGNALNYYFVAPLQYLLIVLFGVLYYYFEDSKCMISILFYATNSISIYLLKKFIYTSKLNENTLDNAAYMDVLTKCINRQGLLRYLADKVESNDGFFLFFLDLDNFKAVNDTLGHESGDDLLKFVTSKWSTLSTSTKNVLARLGGDEFALVLETEDPKEAAAVAKEMLNSIQTGNELASYVTSSIGIASYPIDTRDIPKLLSYADTAMYKAKTSGKNRFLFFDSKMYKEIVDRYNIEKNIKYALDSNQFYLVYQGQYLSKSEELAGYEALIRMHTKSGDIMPENFIGVAEQSGLIRDIDSWVLKATLLETKQIIDKHKNTVIAVNLSGKHLCDISLVDDIVGIIEETNFPPKNLEFEITESSYIKHIDGAVNNIKKLKELGCRIALDDFGTGYSSLSYLTMLHVDIVKIDKSFIDDIDQDEKYQFVNIIVKLAHLLKCKVIAEGVESRDQLEILRGIGVDMVQGYLWGKPDTIDSIIE